MKIIQSPKRYKVEGHHTPHTVTLHHTAGGRIGSEDYLIQINLGYHFIIDRDGTIYAYNPIADVVGHSLHANSGYIGVSFVAGGDELGPVQSVQYKAAIDLLSKLRQDNSETLHYVSDHATIDVLVSGRKEKSDPQWPGEKVNQNDWSIKHHYIDMIATDTGLEAIKTDGKVSIGVNNGDVEDE